MRLLAPFLVYLLFFPLSASGFPELIRHGYVNCTTCHVSPTGGGILTDYGRTFSGEGLSAFATPGEEDLLHGLVPRPTLPEWLNIGGQARAVQVHRENESVREGRFIWMQADLETAVMFKGFTFDVAAGRFQIAREEPRLKARRAYLMYEFNDEWRVRAGKFIPAYGIQLADHVISTRAPLGFDQGLDRLAFELSWLHDTYHLIFTASQGPVEYDPLLREDAVGWQAAYAFWDTYKIGFNAWRGQANAFTRDLVGVYAHLGFSERWYLLSEFDLQKRQDKTRTEAETGWFTYHRLGYEFSRGFHLLTTIEGSKTDLRDDLSTFDRYGLGLAVYPRPHFELQAIWNKQRAQGSAAPFEDYAWIMMQYYL